MVNSFSMLDSIRMCFFHIFKAILAQKAHPLSLSITFYSVLSRAEKNHKPKGLKGIYVNQ
jgi:hypothetical protein